MAKRKLGQAEAEWKTRFHYARVTMCLAQAEQSLRELYAVNFVVDTMEQTEWSKLLHEAGQAFNRLRRAGPITRSLDDAAEEVPGR